MARKEFETLTPQMYYILLVLMKPRHGYEIMSEVSALTNGNINVGPGTLYTLLSRFETEGYIRLDSVVDKKKIYIITSFGKKKLKLETERILMQVQHYNEIFDMDEKG